jgi:hypothetical protein
VVKKFVNMLTHTHNLVMMATILVCLAENLLGALHHDFLLDAAQAAALLLLLAPLAPRHQVRRHGRHGREGHVRCVGRKGDAGARRLQRVLGWVVREDCGLDAG